MRIVSFWKFENEDAVGIKFVFTEVFRNKITIPNVESGNLVSGNLIDVFKSNIKNQ